MQRLDDTLRVLGLAHELEILPVLSGYPSPRYVNLVLRRLAGRTYLFESSASRPDIVTAVGEALDAREVARLDALLLTHCHGDHAGSAGILAGRGRAEGERAPIYLHTAAFRFLTQPDASFLQESHELFLARAQCGLPDYSSPSYEQTLTNERTLRLEDIFTRPPRGAHRLRVRRQPPIPTSPAWFEGHR